MTEELKPCPWCSASGDSLNSFLIENLGFYFISCRNCRCKGPDGHTEKEAEEAWNGRTGE